VLLGNLDLCRLKWPKGQAGEDMDVLARRWLWAANLDYNHGTGHGVGYFLNVHEGPHGIGKHWSTPLEVGMHVTDEPGYYEEGSFGIRIEDVLVVKQAEGRFLEFENITICPYDKGLLDLSLLSPRDIRYIDLYHQRVWSLLAQSLQSDQIALEWLRRATSPISS
jgi:Xaa-Pro aminopeptidase